MPSESDDPVPDGRERTPVVVSTPEAWDAAGSPPRADLLTFLEGLGPATVAELAAAMGRPADRLYRHLRVLEAAGLVRTVGYRQSGRHSEAVLDLAGDALELDVDPATGHNVDPFLDLASALLRRADREFARAVRAEQDAAPPCEACRMRAEIARLHEEDEAEITAHLDAIVDVFRRARGRTTGRSVRFTFALHPVVP